MTKNLERKRFRVKNEEGKLIGDITAISMVSQPAIEKDFQLFNAVEKKKSHFQITNNEKMEVTGPVMIPDQDILRYDEETKSYYYCYFTEQDVKDYSEIYLKDSHHTQANFEHSDDFTSDFFICESWIVVDPAKDKSNALGFKDVTPGTWFCTYKTYNVDLWNQIKESNLAGFSVEISLNDFEKEVEDYLTSIIENIALTDEEKRSAIKEYVNSKLK